MDFKCSAEYQEFDQHMSLLYRTISSHLFLFTIIHLLLCILINLNYSNVHELVTMHALSLFQMSTARKYVRFATTKVHAHIQHTYMHTCTNIMQDVRKLRLKSLISLLFNTHSHIMQPMQSCFPCLANHKAL